MSNCVVFAVRGVDPVMHKYLRMGYLDENGSLTGLYAEALPEAYILLNEVDKGCIGISYDEAYDALDAHNLPPIQHEDGENVDIEKRVFKKDLTYFKLYNTPLESVKELNTRHSRSDRSTYGGGVSAADRVIKFLVGMRLGLVHIAKESRRYAERVLRDGVVSPLHEEVKEGFKAVDDKFNVVNSELRELKEFIMENADKVRSIPRKVRRKVYKMDKALTVLDDVKKYRESVFSRRDYKSSLMRVYGQADDRTVDSDLKVLLNEGEAVLEPTGAYEKSVKYRFAENSLFEEFQGPEARRAFNQAFKSEFTDWKEISKKDFVAFVKRFTGLSDGGSVRNRLETLVDIGWLVPLDETGRVYTVNI